MDALNKAKEQAGLLQHTAAPVQAQELPKWIDDAKGKDPFTDDLIAEIERLRGVQAAPSVPEDVLWELRDAILDALFRKAAPHAWEGLVSETAYAFITKRREAIAAAPAAQAPDAKDAQRYRWLRDEATRMGIASDVDGDLRYVPGPEADDAIDAAMQENGNTSTSDKCPNCNGSGIYAKALILPEPPDVKCVQCNGTGKVWNGNTGGAK